MYMNDITATGGHHAPSFLGRQVYAEHAVGTGAGCIAGESFFTVVKKRIVVAEQYQGHVGPRTQRGDHFEYSVQAGSGLQRPLARRLNDRTICHGIRKRHAQLNDISAGVNSGEHRVVGLIYARIANREKRYQGRSALGRQLVQAALDPLFASRHDASDLDPEMLGNRRHILVSTA